MDPAGDGHRTFSALIEHGGWFYFGTLGRIDADFAGAVFGGPERQVLDAISGRGWVVAEDGIYHFGLADAQGAYPFQFFGIAKGETRVLTTIASAPGIGLAVSPDRRTFLFSTTKPVDHDLMLIENFR